MVLGPMVLGLNLERAQWPDPDHGREARVGNGRSRTIVAPDDASGDAAYVLKRVVRDGERWLLASDNPAGPTIPASADTTAIAIREQVARPEDGAPAGGARG